MIHNRLYSFAALLLMSTMFWAGCPSRQKVKKPYKPRPPAISLDFPVKKGVLFRTFSQKPSRLHEGLSIGAPTSTPVSAAQNGKVIYASNAQNHLGKMVIIRHRDPFTTIYGHLDKIHVKVGQVVKKGDRIGTVGTTGGVDSPRVYFQLRQERLPVDPEPFLSSHG